MTTRGSILNTQVANASRDTWESASPADPHHPALEASGIGVHHLRQQGGDLLIPLMRDPDLTPSQSDDLLSNLLVVTVSGEESTVAVEATSHRPGQDTRKIYPRTMYAAAVFGKPSARAQGRLVGKESTYMGGGMAGASEVYICTGWRTAAKLHEAIEHPAVATRTSDELLELSKAIRRNMPAQVAITIAATADEMDQAQAAADAVNARLVLLDGQESVQ